MSSCTTRQDLDHGVAEGSSSSRTLCWVAVAGRLQLCKRCCAICNARPEQQRQYDYLTMQSLCSLTGCVLTAMNERKVETSMWTRSVQPDMTVFSFATQSIMLQCCCIDCETKAALCTQKKVDVYIMMRQCGSISSIMWGRLACSLAASSGSTLCCSSMLPDLHPAAEPLCKH